ncbi:hypothetical protein IG631_17492 [Alternaria alternata]|nr:hypothetical protein IG631_17492 [Alternaria alternata]
MLHENTKNCLRTQELSVEASSLGIIISRLTPGEFKHLKFPEVAQTFSYARPALMSCSLSTSDVQDFGQPTDSPVPPSLQLPFVSSHLTGLLRLCHCYARLMSTLGPIQSNDLDYQNADSGFRCGDFRHTVFTTV